MLELGDIGHVLVILSFLLSLVGIYSNIKYTQSPLEWKGFSRGVLYGHSFAVLGVIVALFTIIHQHDYRYHYAWSHSSNELPVHYMISCFWEGQEGSFLLWIFWNMVLANILILVSKKWEGPVMTVFFIVQAFLTSMILGMVIGDLKIGSSPFVMLREVFPDAPVFSNPDFRPENGQGLNPLLQNYWMVIHPPTLFLGFSLTTIPFAYCVAGLWQNKLTEWIHPSIPWTIFSSAVLGLGIIMGGYWAYETLNFGGYWNWDPVENAVLVPWIVQIAALHVMMLYKRQKSMLGLSAILVISVFLLILYSTFLTRSGVLGEASVHSFTDLGLSGQLLVYLFAFLIGSVGLLVWKYKQIPALKEEKNATLSNLIMIGTAILCFSAFQVLFGTSLPVINKIAALFGGDLNKTPLDSEDYNQWQIWFAAATAWVAGITQFSWWRKESQVVTKRTVNYMFYITVSLLIVSAAMIYWSEYDAGFLAEYQRENANGNPDFTMLSYSTKILAYILLFSAAAFSLFISILTFMKMWKQNKKNVGGAVAHIGFALMLFGMLFSSGYSQVVSLNRSGFLFSKEATKEFNAENVLLRADSPTFMNNYQLVYRGQRLEAESFPGYIAFDRIFPTMDERKYVARETISWKGKAYYQAGDTIEIKPENTYYEIEYVDEDMNKFTLFPRAQQNPQMGFIASPDVRRNLAHDLYTHIASVPNSEVMEWSDSTLHTLSLGDTLNVNGFFGRLDSVRQVKEIPGVKPSEGALLNTAYFTFTTQTGEKVLSPSIVFNRQGREASTFELDLNMGVRMYLEWVAKDKLYLVTETTNPDYVIMKAVKKPLINFLWVGTIILVIGFLIAAWRRYLEFKKSDS